MLCYFLTAVPLFPVCRTPALFSSPTTAADNDNNDDDVVVAEGGARAKAVPSDMADFAMPPAGRSLPTLWVDNSSHAADHAAAGDFQARIKTNTGILHPPKKKSETPNQYLPVCCCAVEVSAVLHRRELAGGSYLSEPSFDGFVTL